MIKIGTEAQNKQHACFHTLETHRLLNTKPR